MNKQFVPIWIILIKSILSKTSKLQKFIDKFKTCKMRANIFESFIYIVEIEKYEQQEKIELVDCDHDLGDFAIDGGDGIKLLDWLLERGTLYPVKLHTMNPVGRDNMQRMLDRYWNK